MTKKTYPIRLLLSNDWDDEVESPTEKKMRAFLDKADPDDWEHGGVSLAWTDLPLREPVVLFAPHDPDRPTNESREAIHLQWTAGRLVYYSPHPESPRHLRDVKKAKVFALWKLLAARKLDEIEREEWQPGDGDMSPEEKRAFFKAAQRDVDREFYDSLGEERPNTKCRKEECNRGTVALSVFCRPHHFRSVQGRKCPFED